MRALFVLTIFLGSALLFLVQPMVAKMLLPAYGGTPAVWNTAMVFFQAVLLLGYGYAHLSYRWLGPKIQPVVHIVMAAGAALLLPIAFGNGDAESAPMLRLLTQLALGAGIPFFIVSAGAPLVQRWYATTGGPGAKDPYFLYAASNLASILALLGYPLLVEPLLRLHQQSELWRMGYWGLVVLLAAAGGTAMLHNSSPEPKEVASTTVLDRGQVLHWIALSFVPSSLLLGVTTYLTTNIAAAPLLWVVPLSLYLLTFVLAFSSRRPFGSLPLGRIVSILMAPMVLVIVLEASDPILVLAGIHLVVFTLGALMCHTRLHETRPDPSHLTAFYFWISVGGVLGGVFNALLAPTLFDSLSEYPIALVALILLVPKEKPLARAWPDWAIPVGVGVLTAGAILVTNAAGMAPGPMRTGITLGAPALLAFAFAERPVRYGLSLGAVFLVARLLQVGATGQILVTERSFFGVHRVTSTEGGRFHELMHGNTIHGKQNTDPALKGEPLTYYHRTGPIGQAFAALQEAGRVHSVGLVGMGVGSLAAYGEAGQTFTFYEIDPDVIHIARDSGLFSFIPDAKAEIRIVLGDARLKLATAPEGAYDFLVLDAFSSDAIPTHLLTVEALKLYRSKLAPGGILAFHISNRYLELEPVVAAGAREAGFVAIIQDDEFVSDQDIREGKFRSTWVLLGADEGSLEPMASDNRWSSLPSAPDEQPWTDDFSNLIRAFIAGMRQ